MPARIPADARDADHVDNVVDGFRIIYNRMRAESQAAVDLWLEGALRSLGGTLVIQGPSASAKRDLPEAALASERFATLAESLIPGGSSAA